MSPKGAAGARPHRLWTIVLIGLMTVVSLAGCGSQAGSPATESKPAASTAGTAPSPSAPVSSAATRTITDMVGRQVTIPATVNSVATIGPVPALNTILFAIGEGDKIANGLPQFAQSPRFQLQHVFAPDLANKPVVQEGGGASGANTEELLKLDPDVVISYPQHVEALQNAGLTAVAIDWNNGDQLRQILRMAGEIFNKPERADAYITYLDEVEQRVQNEVGSIPEQERPSVLYLTLDPLGRPGAMSDWWITAAGGRSVTYDHRDNWQFKFTTEQLINWDPDVLIASNPEAYDQLTTDPLYSTLKAVKNQRVYTPPIGAFFWGQGTTENPLTILWAAKQIYPDRFTDLDLAATAKDFYQTFYGTTLTDEQIQGILTNTR